MQDAPRLKAQQLLTAAVLTPAPHGPDKQPARNDSAHCQAMTAVTGSDKPGYCSVRSTEHIRTPMLMQWEFRSHFLRESQPCVKASHAPDRRSEAPSRGPCRPP